MKCERCDAFSARSFGTFFKECQHPVGKPTTCGDYFVTHLKIKALRKDKNPRLLWICADCMNCYDHPEDI